MTCAYNTGGGVSAIGVTVAWVAGTDVSEGTIKAVSGEVAVTRTLESSVCVSTGGIGVAGVSCAFVNVGTCVTVAYFIKKIISKYK